MKMKLFTALKLKNRLAGELQQAKAITFRDNCWEDGREPDTELDEIWKQINELTNRLVTLKAAIAAANIGIYSKIEKMSELKGLIAHYKSLTVKEGSYKELSGGFSREVVERTYYCFLNQSDVDALVATLQKDIHSLQDEIDEYNATTSVEIPD